MPDQPLVVPMQLDALVANQGVLGSNSFRTWPFNYQSLGDFRSPEPLAGDRQTGTMTQGVYLHWTLPEALRHGTRDIKTGEFDYPLVPNRWLIVRLNGSGRRQPTAWVIESDCPAGTNPVSGPARSSLWLVDPDLLNLWKSSPDPNRNQFTPVMSNDVPVGQIGASFPIGSWNERSPNSMFLTAVAPSNPLYSIYVPQNAGVFSFYDDLNGIDADTLSYFVFGWFSDPTQDILSSWVVNTASKTPYADLLAQLEWTVVGGSETQAVSSVYHGMVCNIAWARNGSLPAPDPLQRIRDSGKLNVAVGNTTIDALTALIARQTGDPVKAELLRAFQYDFLQQLNQPNGEALLEEKIRQEWFGSSAGGYSWTIVENNSDGSTAVNLTDAEAAWLLALNQNQAAADAALATLYGLQWSLHSLWFKNRYLNCSDNTFPKPPAGVGDLQQFLAQLGTQLDPTQSNGVAAQLVAQFATVQSLLATLPQPNWAGTTNAQTAFQNGILAYAASKGLDSTKTLKVKAAPRYWKTGNPVVLFSGVQPAATAVSEESLPVRLGSHLITGLNVDGTIDAAAVASVLPQYPSFNAIQFPVVQDLLNEFFFLDQANIAGIIDATKGNAADITAAMTSYDPAAYQGPLPALTLGNWQQPWSPMFLEWKVNYIDVPVSANAASWSFDGTDYHYTQAAGAPPTTTRSAGGISLLSPHASFVFGSRLQEFVKKFGTGTAIAQLEQWIETTYQWQFLAQELVGLNDSLALRDTRAYRRPVESDALGSYPVAALTGYGDGTIPASLALPAASLGMVNTVPFIPNGPALPFTATRHGQIYFTDVYLYDKFGRVLFAVQSGTQSGLFDYTNFPVQIDSVMLPDAKIPSNVASVMQLPPRVLQNARLDMQLLDAIDDTKVYGLNAGVTPIAGWVLPNHLDESLLLFAPDGTALGEFSLYAGPDGTRTGQWSPPPHSAFTMDDVTRLAPHVAEMISSPQIQAEAAFNAFLASIDTTLWSTDPLGNRVDQNLSVLVGRPLALLRTRLQFQLQGAAIADTGFAATFSPPSPDFLSYPFSIRLGDQATREDGVIGYFTGSNYDQFNSVAGLGDGAPQQSYVTPVGPLGALSNTNYLKLSFAPDTYLYLTVLADPRAAVHATTGILPVKQLDLPQQFVDAALSQMEISFRMGPLLTQLVPSPTEAGTPPAHPQSIVYPLPAEQNGVWSWWEPGAGSWAGYDLVRASADAQFPTSPNTLREGSFQFVTTLTSGSQQTHPASILPVALAERLATSAAGVKQNLDSVTGDERHMNLAASPLLLGYFFSTDPAPIQVSTTQTTTNARINTSVSPAGTGPVYCNKILLAYPTGADPDEVYAAAPSASLNTAAWSVTTQVVKGSDLGLADAVADADYTTFIFQCNSAQYYLINYNLVFGALGSVNLAEGDFDILVQENSGTSSDPTTFTPKQGSFTLTKGLPQFYLNNFVATNPNAPTVPATDFTAASPIYFEWESNGTFYQIFQQNQTQPVYAGTATNFTLSAGLVRDTTFILVAMVSGNPSGDQGQGGFEPIFLYSPLTITISNPTLTPSSVTAGTLSVTGNSTLTGTLNVTGSTTAGSVQASSLGVSGNSSLTTATVSGTLGVTGQATTNGLTINGALSAMGLATFSAGVQGTGGPVALMNAAQAVNPGTYAANTDGFVIGFCSWPSNFNLLCLGAAWGSSGSATVRATGGSFCLLNSGGSKYWGSNANAFMLPVNNGATWSVQSLQASNNEAAAPTAFWWVPVGTPAGGAETFTQIGEAPKVEFPNLHRLPAKKPKHDYVPNLVEVIESIAGKKLDRKHREALTEVLTKMNED